MNWVSCIKISSAALVKSPSPVAVVLLPRRLGGRVPIIV